MRTCPWLLITGVVLAAASAFAGSEPPVDRWDPTAAESEVIAVASTAASDEVGPAEGGGAPRSWVLFDNGPIITPGSACTTGVPSLLQSVSLCLNAFGWGCSTETAGGANWLADDFVLSQAAYVESITVYAYETSATGNTITAGRLNVRASPPVNTTDGYVRETTLLSVSATGIWRQSQTSPACTRRMQQVTFRFLPSLQLSAGTYWVSWQLTGSTSYTGPWCPPVTLVGSPGKPGANALGTAAGGTVFGPIVDAGTAGCVPAPPTPNPQDFFLSVFGFPVCPGDADDDGDTDQDDMDIVLFYFDTSQPTGANGDVDRDGDVDQDDLDYVLFYFACGT